MRETRRDGICSIPLMSQGFGSSHPAALSQHRLGNNLRLNA